MFVNQSADLRRQFPACSLTFLPRQRRLFSTRRTSVLSPRSPLIATPCPLRNHASEIHRRHPFDQDRARGRSRVCTPLPHHTCRLSLPVFHHVTLGPTQNLPGFLRFPSKSTPTPHSKASYTPHFMSSYVPILMPWPSLQETAARRPVQAGLVRPQAHAGKGGPRARAQGDVRSSRSNREAVAGAHGEEGPGFAAATATTVTAVVNHRATRPLG